MSLRKLSPSTARRLSSSRVISSVCDAVKELVENALDSGASTIHVKLVNYGLERIEVQDDGCGVPGSQVEHMCLPYYTSKINEFSDLGSKLETYGFRGEALASLCNVSDVEITTRTQNDEYASVFTFDKSGKVVDSKPSHFTKGTTVTLQNIFGNLPVRKKFISSSNKSKAELKRTEILVKNFAIVNPGVYFLFWHNKFVEWRKASAQTLKESIKFILGYSIASELEEISTIHKKSTITLVLPRKQCKALAILCYANVDVVRIFVNRRPVRYHKFQKIALKCITDYFGGNLPPGKYPTCVINIQMPSNEVDVNIEANKMKVMCHEEDELLVAAEKLFLTYYSSDVLGAKTLIEEKAPTSHSKQAENNKEGNVDKSPFNQQVADAAMGANLKNKIPVSKNDDLWALADNAVNFWNRNCVKSASGDVIEGRVHSDLEESSKNSQHIVRENCSKRARMDEEKDKQSSCLQFKLQADDKMNNVGSSAIQEKETSDVIGSVKNANSRTLHGPLIDDTLDTMDSTMSLWSRGHAQSSSGDIVKGGAVLLQPKHSCINSELMKNAMQAKSKPTTATGKKNYKSSHKFNSSFHSVSSQMGCKEMSGFTKFCRDRRPKILLETPGMSYTEVAKMLSEEWKKLSSEEKSNFDKIAESTIPTETQNITLCDTSSKVPDKSLISPVRKAQNRSLIDMFDKLNKSKISITWEVSENDWKLIPQTESSNSWLEGLTVPAKLELLHIILPEELWICKRGQEVGVIRPSCFQEKIYYKQLESSYSVPVIPLDEQLLLHERDFEPELWHILMLMETKTTNSNLVEVVSPIITKNGFRLIWSDGELYLTHVASTIRHYGINELQEVLLLSKHSSNLSQCRPVKVIAYLENEAVRVSIQKNSAVSKENISELLEMWTDMKDDVCFHQKPIFKVLYTLPLMEN